MRTSKEGCCQHPEKSETRNDLDRGLRGFHGCFLRRPKLKVAQISLYCAGLYPGDRSELPTNTGKFRTSCRLKTRDTVPQTRGATPSGQRNPKLETRRKGRNSK